MNPLDGPLLKLRRAESQIKRLRLAEDAFRKNAEYRISRAEFNPKTGNYVYRVRTNTPPPSPEWSIYIGEVAYNLRSALDQLVYQLALSEAPCETVARSTTLQFPIFIHRASKRRMRTFKRSRETMIGLLKSKHQTLIERLQPYKRRCILEFKPADPTKNGGRNSPLFWLEKINNADKHRLIQIVSSQLGIGIVLNGNGFSPNRGFSKLRVIKLKDGAKFGEAPANMNVKATITPIIAFDSGCQEVRGMPVVYVLESITEHVSKIINIFSNEF